MRVRTLLLLCLAAAVLNVLVALPSQAVPATAADCLDLGFEKDTVRCSMCSTLFFMTQNTELRQECQRCCTAVEGDAADDVTYVSGRIELRNIAHVMESWEGNSLTIFKRKYKSEPYFKHLSFVEKSSLLFPQVVLVGSDPQDVLTLQIAGWPPETIHDLFKKKIQVK